MNKYDTPEWRFIFSLFSNIARSSLAFFSGIIIARTLGPQKYGEYGFLIGTFSAMCAFIDLGSTSTFFTFISQRKRTAKLYFGYILWIVAQALITASILLFLPNDSLNRLFLTEDRVLLLIAYASIFTNLQVSNTASNILESTRNTKYASGVSVATAALYLLATLYFSVTTSLNLRLVLILAIAQNIITSGLQIKKICQSNVTSENNDNPVTLSDFIRATRPLFISSLFIFFYNFAERWILQKYAGPTEQGYFHVANQMSAAILIVTTSLIKILWKEVAAAIELGQHEYARNIYLRSLKIIVTIGAVISGTTSPLAGEILDFTVGVHFQTAWPTLSLMLIYPLIQSVGQLGGTVLLAKGRTDIHSKLTIFSVAISVPTTYVMIAAPGLGLNLGATGMAFKLIVIGVISITIQSHLIQQAYEWRPLGLDLYRRPFLLILCGWFIKCTIFGLLSPERGNFYEMLSASLITAGVFLTLSIYFLRLDLLDFASTLRSPKKIITPHNEEL